jgi:hypothetical protein
MGPKISVIKWVRATGCTLKKKGKRRKKKNIKSTTAEQDGGQRIQPSSIIKINLAKGPGFF